MGNEGEGGGQKKQYHRNEFESMRYVVDYYNLARFDFWARKSEISKLITPIKQNAQA